MLEPVDKPEHLKARLKNPDGVKMDSWVDTVYKWSPVMEEEDEQNMVELEISPRHQFRRLGGGIICAAAISQGGQTAPKWRWCAHTVY